MWEQTRQQAEQEGAPLHDWKPISKAHPSGHVKTEKRTRQNPLCGLQKKIFGRPPRHFSTAASGHMFHADKLSWEQAARESTVIKKLKRHVKLVFLMLRPCPCYLCFALTSLHSIDKVCVCIPPLSPDQTHQVWSSSCNRQHPRTPE
jgi:hypothetical protein